MAPSMVQVYHDFFTRIKEDPRVGASHISLFSALVYWHALKGEHPVCFFSGELRQLSKLSSRTYYKCIGELHRYGYIKYEPSCNPASGSVAYLIGREGASIS